MNKMNNKRIVSSLLMLAVLSFGVITIPAKASAEGGVNYIYRTNTIPTPAEPTPAPTPIVRSSTSNASKTASTTKSTTVAKATPAKSTTDASSLTANAISGANSFTPSGIVQWILFAIVILILVILGRKAFGADKKYHAEPMKHA